MKIEVVISACVLTSFGAVLAQSGNPSGGAFNIRQSGMTRSGAQAWVQGDPGDCNCLVDPIEITPPGVNDFFCADSVNWKPGANPIAGLSVDQTGGLVIPLPGGYFIPTPIHGDVFIGDITNYLEEWKKGTCPTSGTRCEEGTGCYYKISFTIDASAGLVNGPVEFVGHSGSVTETKEVDKSKPQTGRVVSIGMTAAGHCGSGADAYITSDCGYFSPTRVFQTLRIDCTRCSAQ